MKKRAKKKAGKRYRMVVVDLTNGEPIDQGTVSKQVAAEILRTWPAKQLNALVFFVPDWAKVSISCDPIGAFDSRSAPLVPR